MKKQLETGKNSREERKIRRCGNANSDLMWDGVDGNNDKGTWKNNNW